MEKLTKRRGRPPEGLAENGEPARIRDYPRLLFTMRPETRSRLKAIAGHEDRAEWKIVEDAIGGYFDRLPSKDRRAIEALEKSLTRKTR